MATGIAAVAGIGVVVLFVLLARSRREQLRLRDRLERASGDLQNLQLAFSRFAPDEVIEGVIARGLSETGQKKEVTVLFADLVGFTALSERTEPTVLVGILNGYFERMSEAITDHRGHVSTFIGDGVLAFFGSLSTNPWQGNDAAHAAIAMQRAIVAYNEELEAKGLPALAIGIGIHRGIGIAGLVGSQALKEFTVIGRTVNVASRVQDLTRQLDGDIIITEALQASLDPRFRVRTLPATAVKGVADPIEIFALEGYDAA